ncbi:MAG: cupin domain-containing protein [Acetobacteraceae bacterium]|nr:cupin domain-containing protein [Acetobacteraceae bacterium]
MQQPASLPHVARNDDAPAYWFLDILWIVLIGAEASGGRCTVMEQLMPQGAGPSPHVHPFHDEWFYVMEGALDLEVDGRRAAAGAGAYVFVPRNAVHAFKVVSPTARVLNGFTPAAMDQLVTGLARPAERRELPPKGLDTDPAKLAMFANNYWGMTTEFPHARQAPARS